jgi:hypothetical protein
MLYLCDWCLFNDAVSNSAYIVSCDVNMKECIRKGPRPNLRHYLCICLKGLRKTQKEKNLKLKYSVCLRRSEESTSRIQGRIIIIRANVLCFVQLPYLCWLVQLLHAYELFSLTEHVTRKSDYGRGLYFKQLMTDLYKSLLHKGHGLHCSSW